MSIEELREILEKLNIGFDEKPRMIYIFYETPDGMVNNLSVSLRRAKRRDGRYMNQRELMELTQKYPVARESKVIAVEHPNEGLTRWLDTVDVCEKLHTTRQTLRRWVLKGLLHPSRTGRRIYFDAKEVERLLNSNVIQENGRVDATGGDTVHKRS